MKVKEETIINIVIVDKFIIKSIIRHVSGRAKSKK